MDIKPWTLVQFRDSDDEPWSAVYAYLWHIKGAKYPHVGLQIVTTKHWQKYHCFCSGSFKQVKQLKEH